LRLLSASWSDFLASLAGDLAPLGFTVDRSDGEKVTVAVTRPADTDDSESFWENAHQHRQQIDGTVRPAARRALFEFRARVSHVRQRFPYMANITGPGNLSQACLYGSAR
jgi:hypothetical protein